ncbi:MAG: TonB-dependent receptor [Prevotella sp.]|nr:TonB-dependent receptor [Prevotella sp.]
MKRILSILTILLTTATFAMAQKTIDVAGTVVDETGEPLIGVSVTVKGNAGLGVITDIDGNYKIKVEEYKSLIFSYVGFMNAEMLIKPGMNRVDITMKEDVANAIDEVVVTGMGIQKKLTVTGAVTNVNVSDLKHYSTSNLTNTLAGNVPGIMAFQSSGQPGKNTSEFWIRGISTFGAGSSAYILVDGFERDKIDDLNIEDIESFTILKDASATAIYGSKGANGVILITTKHGIAGKVNINAKAETSYNTRTITPEFVDGYTYANLINEARITRNYGVLYRQEELELIRLGLDPDLYPNVNWQDLLLKDGAWSRRANVNLSGGGETARYFASASYNEDEGMYKTDGTLKDKYDTNANYKRWNYRLNVDIDVTPTTLLKLGVSGDLTTRNSPGLGDDKVWGQLFGYNSLFSPILYSNGYVPSIGAVTSQKQYINGVEFSENQVNLNYVNPWASSTQTGYNTEWNNNLQSNVTLEQDLSFITKGLRFTGRFGYDTYNSNAIHHVRMPALYEVRQRSTETGALDFHKVMDEKTMTQSTSNDGSRREFLDLLLHWDRLFWDAHHFGVNVKFTQDQNITTQNLGSDIKNSVSRKNQGLAAQATYNYKNRYFFDYNFGYNGSENFSDGHRWGFFPAWSVAWNVGEEPWVKQAAPWLDMFKIRYSHGKVGNDKTGDRFPYLYLISNLGVTDTQYTWGDERANGYSGYRFEQLASNGVTWEVARKDDLGIDLVLFNNKFSLTVDYFSESRSGIYMERKYLPIMTGLVFWDRGSDHGGWNYVKANVGKTSTKGFDGNFKFEDRFGDVSLTVRGNITYSKGKILEYDEPNSVYPYQLSRGYRINQERGLIALGLFKDYDDIRNSPTQTFGTVQPGDIKYKDVNGDGVVDDGDVVAIGATSRPNLIYGLGFSIVYKGFDFNLHFQGAGKSTFPIYGKCVYAFSENQWGNIFKGMLEDRWVDHDTAIRLQELGVNVQPNENPNASYPRLSYGGNSNNYRNSTFWLRDGSYLRLKNLDFGYTLPKAFVNKFHFNNIRIFVTGTNLFFLSKKFDTWDPESLQPRGEDYPITKAVTAGIQLNL